MSNLFKDGKEGTFNITNDPSGNPPSDWNFTKASGYDLNFNNTNPITGAGSAKISYTPPSFIYDIQTTNNNETFKLPLLSAGTYNFTVNWGDGNSDVITAYNQPEVTHTFATPGTYTVDMSGVIELFAFSNSGDKDKIYNIKQWGSIVLGSGSFYGCSNLDVTATDAPVLQPILNNFFLNCTSLVYNTSINNWDTSNVTSLGNFFRGTFFNQPIGNWDTSNVTSTIDMFRFGVGFDQDLSNWNITSLTSAIRMFLGQTLSTSNYDALLIGWESQSVQNNVTFDAGNSKYTLGGAAETARTNLINDHNWTITDGGGV